MSRKIQKVIQLRLEVEVIYYFGGWGGGMVAWLSINQQIEPKQVCVGDPKRTFGLICKWAMPFTNLRRLKVAWEENHTIEAISSENAVKTKVKIIQNRIVGKSIHVTTTATLDLMRKLCWKLNSFLHLSLEADVTRDSCL